MSNHQNVRRIVVPLRTREDVNWHQVDLLLMVLNNLQQFLVATDARDGVELPEMDGGVVSAAFATFAKATDRLDAILDDASRWDIKEINALHDSLIATQTAQQTFLAAQAKSANEILRPSFQCRPVLYASGDKFLAVWGDNPAIVGIGVTPASAMDDFDAAFYRTAQEQTKLVLEEQPIPPTVKPTRKKSK